MLRFISKALMAGIFFGAGFLLFLWGYSKLNPPNMDGFHLEQMASKESKLEKPCLEIYQDAAHFLVNDMSAVIELGERGEDWLSSITDEQVALIDANVKSLFECTLIDYHANELNYEWPDFWPLHNILSTFGTYAGNYDSRRLTASELKPSAFDKLASEYENVTSQLCSAPSALDSQSCASAAAH